MNICFILWVMFQYYVTFLLKSFQLWPLGALSVRPCVPLIHPHFLPFKNDYIFFHPFSFKKYCTLVIIDTG